MKPGQEVGKMPVELRKTIVFAVNDLIRSGMAVSHAVATVAGHYRVSARSINRYRRSYGYVDPEKGTAMAARLRGLDVLIGNKAKQFMPHRGVRRALAPEVLEWIKFYRVQWPDRSIERLHRDLVLEFGEQDIYLPSSDKLKMMAEKGKLHAQE